MLYSDKVMDHFANPRNVGEIADADGVGEVGNAKCGDIMKMFLKIKDGKIEDVKFKTFGCGAAIATSSIATEMIKGKPIEEVVEWLEANKQHSVVFFSVDDLNYLKRGGRLSGGAAFFGTVLDLKPILHTSAEGRLEPIEKIKGRKKAWRRMAELVKERGIDLEENEILLLYANEDDAKVMEANLQELCHPKSIEFWPVGPVIGGHAGPRVMGLACWGTER